MVQVIENRADIHGRLLAIKPDATRPDHKLVTIEVGATTPVEGYPNLFSSASGSQLDVIMPADLAEPLKIGTAVRCRIRRAGPTTVIADHCKPR